LVGVAMGPDPVEPPDGPADAPEGDGWLGMGRGRGGGGGWQRGGGKGRKPEKTLQ
jgi:hypothetical protein